MKLFFSASTGGFYSDGIHGSTTPTDAIEITNEERAALLAGQYAGKVIVCDDHGAPFLADPPPPTAAQITASLTAAVQIHMDSQARALNYDDIKTAVTYADEPAVPKFQAEGQMFREWRSLCWAHYYAAMAAVHLGERAITTAEELIAELPPLVLPA